MKVTRVFSYNPIFRYAPNWDYLANVGMRDVVIERETLTVNYEEPLKLMKDLKGLGATNASSARNKNLTGPDTIRKVIASYNKKRLTEKFQQLMK